MQHIIDDEGYEQFIYLCPAKKRTIGFGFNLDDVGFSYDECVVILQMRIDDITQRLTKAIITFSELSPARQECLVNMAYQLGLDGLLGFRKTIALINAYDYEGAAVEMLDSKWARLDTPERAKRISDKFAKG